MLLYKKKIVFEFNAVVMKYGDEKTARLLVDFEADSSAIDERGALPDHVIGASCPDGIDPALARELSEIVVGHRAKLRGRHGEYENFH